MANLPHEDRSVNLYEFAIEWGLPLPDLGEDWETDCIGGNQLAHNARRATLIHVELRCGKCWDCRVRRCRRLMHEEPAYLDVIQDSRGPMYLFHATREDWLRRIRHQFIRAGAGWRLLSGPEGIIGYVDSIGAKYLPQPPELVRESNLATFIARSTKYFLSINVAELESRTMRRNFGGSFRGIYLRKPSGAKLLKPACSLNTVFEASELYHGEILEGQTPWDTRGVWVRFKDVETSTDAALYCIGRAA